MNDPRFLMTAAVLVVAIIGLTRLYRMLVRRRLAGQVDEVAVLRSSLKEGILYEDEFIRIYMKLLKDGGFLDLFGDKRLEAESTLTALVTESQGHKQVLEKIIKKVR